MDEDNRISITICGDGGCGKSSITLRLVRSEWMVDYDPTIEDSYTITRTIDGTPYYLNLTDTAGQEEYRSLWASSNLHSDAFLLVYDITSTESLHGLAYFMDMIDMEEETRYDAGARIAPVKIVAGNKCDLQAERCVSAKEGLEWARSRGCGFMETSAREMVNVEETFALLVRRVVQARKQAAAQSPSSSSPIKDRFEMVTALPPPLLQHAQEQQQTSSSSPPCRRRTRKSYSHPDEKPGARVWRRWFLGRLKCW